jgi:hypothetical protein
MPRTAFCITAVLATVAAMPALAAPSSFQLTCSNIAFADVVVTGSEAVGDVPVLTAVCLTKAGAPHATSLVLAGISNQNGDLTQGIGGNSSFQATCGNIRIDVDFRNVTLSAICRRINGTFEQTTLPLNNINNSNGVLTQTGFF